MTAIVKQLCTYPIKGLSAQHLESVALSEGRGFPLDRAFAFARDGSGMDPQNPKPMPKSRFHVLARDAALAKLKTHFDTDEKMLTVEHGGSKQIFDCSTPQGAHDAAKLIASVTGTKNEQSPTFIDGGDIRFTDVCMTSPQYMHAISIINLASVHALSEAIGREIDPARFRGNLLVDGWEPFSELKALDQTITVGSAKLRILKRTQRCPATQVNLKTAERDLDIPALIEQHFGHRDMGVYAEVIEGGDIALHDAVTAL